MGEIYGKLIGSLYKNLIIKENFMADIKGGLEILVVLNRQW
jgi:hypothetical protein